MSATKREPKPKVKDHRAACLAELKAAQENHDTEGAHCDADQSLCSLLESIGYEDVVAEYRKVSKWYA